MRAAAVQLTSGADKQANLGRAERLVREAATAGADLVVLPEKFNALGGEQLLRSSAEPLDGLTVSWARELSRELGLWFVPGSITEEVAGESKLRNTSVLIDPDGELRATYRKIHMFDVEVAGKVYRESDAEQAGDEIVLAQAGDLPLGMTICYDLRFPELFRILAVRGAKAFAYPAAFTVPTGKAHWEILVRARAIENQAFMIAAGQVGRHADGYESYGDSMIVDPWGTVLARADTRDEQTIVADLDLVEEEQVREKLPSLANRRPDTYVWPAQSGAAA